jgi:hypothetical protein
MDAKSLGFAIERFNHPGREINIYAFDFQVWSFSGVEVEEFENGFPIIESLIKFFSVHGETYRVAQRY